MKKKLTLAAVFALVNLVLTAPSLSAGWVEDICTGPDGGIVSCCVQCTGNCGCDAELVE